MPDQNSYQSDIDHILSLRHANGGDFWASADGKLYVGNPFSTINCALMLAELGVGRDDPALQGAAGLLFAAQRKDGRFSLGPGAIQPCHTALAAQTLCYLGHGSDERLAVTFRHLLETQQPDSGWRCAKFFYGRGPETEHSNPGPTLTALDAFRFTKHLNRDERLDRAVVFLLRHWETRLPLGPCHHGIGTQFLRVEYPFLKYNIFHYVFVLSHYAAARQDGRFRDALAHLRSKLADGRVVVEETNPRLRRLEFCRKGEISEPAMARYREIRSNLAETAYE